MSPEPVRTRVPWGENATAKTEPSCPARVAISLPVAASHSPAVLSIEPVRTRVPSCENATAVMEAVCPARVATAVPVAASQSRAVLSREPVRTRVPSRENATAKIEPVCPRRTVRSPQPDDQLRHAPSRAATADISGVNIR